MILLMVQKSRNPLLIMGIVFKPLVNDRIKHLQSAKHQPFFNQTFFWHTNQTRMADGLFLADGMSRDVTGRSTEEWCLLLSWLFRLCGVESKLGRSKSDRLKTCKNRRDENQAQCFAAVCWLACDMNLGLFDCVYIYIHTLYRDMYQSKGKQLLPSRWSYSSKLMFSTCFGSCYPEELERAYTSLTTCLKRMGAKKPRALVSRVQWFCPNGLIVQNWCTLGAPNPLVTRCETAPKSHIKAAATCHLPSLEAATAAGTPLSRPRFLQETWEREGRCWQKMLRGIPATPTTKRHEKNGNKTAS